VKRARPERWVRTLSWQCPDGSISCSALLYATSVADSIVSTLISSARSSGRSVLTEIESKRILHSLGLPVVVPEVAATADDAVRAASRIGFPVVLKVLSPDVSHKSDVGGVELNLADEAAVRDAFERIRRSLAAKARDARFEGVAVQPMARQGVELIAGTFRDDRFGPMVMVGLGGVFVEVMKDTSLALAPIGGREASAMLAQLRGAQILRGVRGQPGVDIDAIVSILQTVSGIAWMHPEIAEMDLNPVVAYEDGLAILDARIVLADTNAATPPTDEHRAARLKNLERAFNPRTVAVIGDKRMGGYMWLRAMAHLKGKLYSIQIDPNEIPGIEAMGVENRKSLAEITEPIDYAVSAVPRQIAPRILKDCVANHVGSIGFFTSGFSETSEELGIRLEAELRDIAINSEIALVGPNCMGLYSPGAGLRNFPEEKVGDAGDVCFISQSGTHTINFCLQAPTHGIKVNKAASIGNVLVLEAADYIDLMAADPATRVIGMYIEGARDGRRFFDSVRHAAERHPVVIWKGGVTEAGARATFSHTGSLATAEATWRAVVRSGEPRRNAGRGRAVRARQAPRGPQDGPGRDDRRAVRGNHRHLRDGGPRDSRAVGLFVRRAENVLQHNRRQLPQSARRGWHDRRRAPSRQPRSHPRDSRTRCGHRRNRARGRHGTPRRAMGSARGRNHRPARQAGGFCGALDQTVRYRDASCPRRDNRRAGQRACAHARPGRVR
jgi:acyl-CoA synthetase (NDP forming)